MPTTPKHGLYGKARRAKDLSRSYRLYSQQLIEEYLDWQPAEGEEPNHFIPIKRACEFLPTAEDLTTSTPDDSGAGQFEFDHTKQEPIVDRSTENRAKQALEPPQPPQRAVVSVSDSEPEAVAEVDDKPAVIRPRRARIDMLAEATAAPTASTQGFLIGCGIGGGAAMVLLLLLAWLIG